MAAESGHQPNRVYFDQSGNLHQNGASYFDSTEVQNNATSTDLNNLHNAAGSGAGAVDGMIGATHWIGTYDFSVLGGATVAIAALLPVPCIILDGFVYVDTLPTAAGAATISLGIVTAVDLLAATAKASFVAGTALALIPDPATAASLPLAVTAHKQVTVTVATGPLTAGKFRVVLRVLPTP